MAISNIGASKGIRVYYQTKTKNISFLKMYTILKRMGVENNKFHLVLYDKRLESIDPHDPNVWKPENIDVQMAIIKECKSNFWYFCREVVRIPESGNPKGTIYLLHRGNLTFNYCLTRNLNVYMELPRQNGKSIAACVWYLWLFLFGTTNSQMMFATKTKDFAKENLKRVKAIKELLPPYMEFKYYSETTGKELKGKDSVETIEDSRSKNSIVLIPSARNKTHADQLARGATQPLQWYDEYAFIPYNEVVYASAAPAYSQASLSARKNNKPYGMVITSTPGDMKSDMGRDAFATIQNSAPFTNKMFDWTLDEIHEYRRRNGITPFIYIRFMYYELGRDEEWFKEQCENLKWKWSDIKREVLLEWAKGSSDCPFSEDELDRIEQHIKPPLRVIHVNKYYPVAIYEEFNISDPQIIGVDVSGGYRRDSSTFVAISSKTTKVQAVFNNNRIGLNEFSQLLYTYIRQYSPNALLCIERNSYGEGIISNLRKTQIIQNLYYSFKKDDTRDKFNDGFNVGGNSSSVIKEYGVYTIQKVRETMMDLLKDRVRDHFDKFVAQIILDEMRGLIFDPKKGRIDHSADSHDDTIMAMMIALYVYYYGTNLVGFGVRRGDVPKYGAESIEEDLSNNIKDPIYEVNKYLKKQIMPSRKSMKAYFDRMQFERNLELDQADRYLETKALIGTGKVSTHMFNTNSSLMFRDLNRIDDLEYLDDDSLKFRREQGNGMIFDIQEDDFQQSYMDYKSRDGIQTDDDYLNFINNIYDGN